MTDPRKCPECGRYYQVKDLTRLGETERKQYRCMRCDEDWEGEKISRPQDQGE